jgi:signal peptidase II
MVNFPARLEGLKWLWLTVLIIIFDLWTKNLASQHLQMHDPVAVFSGFNLTLMHNTGAAFSFLGDAGGWQRWFFICLTLVVSTFILERLPTTHPGLWLNY